MGDRIDLRGIDGISGGSDNAFKWGGTTTKSAGYIWLATVGTDTVIRGNTDSDSTAEFEVRIADGSVSHTAYSSADFLLWIRGTAGQPLGAVPPPLTSPRPLRRARPGHRGR